VGYGVKMSMLCDVVKEGEDFFPFNPESRSILFSIEDLDRGRRSKWESSRVLDRPRSWSNMSVLVRRGIWSCDWISS